MTCTVYHIEGFPRRYLADVRAAPMRARACREKERYGMKLISMMDSLLRDRESLYRGAHAGDLGRLCIALLVVFVLTSAIYGAVAGSFRLFHPEYHFSDYELTVSEDTPITGEIAGVNFEKATVYT
ncbi:MAG: hypothetical protein ACE5JM_08360, partial [Armatimonadota bacterium]